MLCVECKDEPPSRVYDDANDDVDHDDDAGDDDGT